MKLKLEQPIVLTLGSTIGRRLIFYLDLGFCLLIKAQVYQGG